MRTDLFDFELPPESIALRPAYPRDAARLLVVQPGEGLQDRQVSDLAQVLRPGDQLVVNDTKVIPAQLAGRRIGRDAEPRIEATLIKRLDGSRWQALVKPAKKLIEGDTSRFGNEGRVCLLGHLDAQVEAKGDNGEVTLTFSWSVLEGDKPTEWRFSSDIMAGKPAGSTFHADYMEAWDPATRLAWEAACIDKLLNCSDGTMGDGRKWKRPATFTFAQRPHLEIVP